VLGTGGSSVVFAARDTRLNQPVAIKVLHPGRVDSHGLERLRREVQAARGGHAHVAAVYDLHEADGVHFLSMELVEGESLRDRLKRNGRLDVDDAVRTAGQVASALAHLHGRGIVHRDVKPGNILLGRNGNAKLCDMGLARTVAPGATVTETAMVVGTPAYMAPEQATGEELTAAADVYALGVTLHQALTGEAPLSDATALSTLMRRQKERPSSIRRALPDAPRWLARLVRRMLEPAPRDRPTAAAVKRALAAGRFRRRPRRRTVLAAAVALIVAVAAAVIAGQLRRSATVRFQLHDREIHGVDATGRVTWRRLIGAGRLQTVRADLDGDGAGELVVCTSAVDGPRGEVLERARVAAFDLRGREVTSVEPRAVIREWAFPYPMVLQCGVQAADLDLDGRSELLLNCNQLHFFPAELLVYWPAHDLWMVLLEHAGRLREIAAIPDRGRPVVRFAGATNRPLMAPVAGEIVLDPSAVKADASRGAERLSRDAAHAAAGAALSWYTIIDPSDNWLLAGLAGLLARPDGTVLRSGSGKTLELDRWGNSLAGPNAGRDLRRSRLAFASGLAGLHYAESSTPATVRRLAAGLRDRAKPLLREPAYRLALDLSEARALARVGDLDGAADLLAVTASEAANEDVALLRAHLLALRGRHGEAASVLEPTVSAPATQRGAYDARLLLLRIAVELRDRALVDRCLFRLGGDSTRRSWDEGTKVAVLARAHLWWDEVTETDRRARSWPYEPAGAALACLARWRTGRTAPSDPETMREGATASPDAPYDFRVAEAAADLGRGRPADALVVLDALIPGLRQAAADDFGNHQLLDLARALHARALHASGQQSEARAEAEALLPALTPNLLPAKVAKEALAAAGKDAG